MRNRWPPGDLQLPPSCTRVGQIREQRKMKVGAENAFCQATVLAKRCLVWSAAFLIISVLLGAILSQALWRPRPLMNFSLALIPFSCTWLDWNSDRMACLQLWQSWW